MKKFLLILIFFDYLISFGQDFSLSIDTNTKEKNKYFLLSKKFILTAWRDDRDCGSLFYVQLNDKDVPIKIGNKTFTRFEGFGSGTYYPEIKYPFDFEPKKVFIHGWFKDSGNFRSCDTRWGANNARFDVKNEKPIDICKTGEVKGRDATQGEVSIASTLEFYIIPLHTLKTSDSNSAKFLPIDVKVPLIAKEGFDSDLYRYEYATQGNNWRPLPAKFQKKQRIDVSAEDVLESKTKAEEMIGKHIYFRVVSYDKDTGLVCSSSNNVDLTVTQAAPLITIKNIQSPLCNSNETTATVTIQLSRKLLGSLEQYKKNRGAYLGEVFNTFSFIKEGGNQTEGAIGINGLPKDLTEYFLQHDRIDNVVLTTASVTTNYQIDIKGKFYYLDSNGQRKDIQLYTDDTQHKGRFTVAVPEPLNSSLYYKYDNQCFGESMGVIILGFSGGTPPYKYIKNGEEPIPVYGNSIYLSSLPSGTYTFTITDKNDCQILKNGVVSPVVVTITQPQIPITITNEIDYISQIRGYGRKDGAIRPIIKGGTTVNGEYLVQLQTQTQTLTFSGTGRRPSGGYQASFDNLDKGTYTLTIQDHKGCILTRVISIVEPPLLTASITATTTIGCNQNNNDPNNHYELYNNGVLSATVEGGVPPYKYFWKKLGRRVPLQGNDKPIIRGLSKGTYQLVVTDKNDNEATAFYTLTEPPQLMLSVTKSEMTCSAPNGGQATAIASGGTPPYTYLWNTGHSGAYITGLSAGKYFVTVSDSRGCSVQEKVVLSYPEEVEVNNTIITPVTCYEGNDGKIALT
ncbi:SprB repeat-containing protein, partial [Capnocytophaga sputigena]|uniref:SprB repeat-containing protein n=1 Tax=Capnocytophaga sputigena TaxID=1019 RepID=UPI0028E7347F